MGSGMDLEVTGSGCCEWVCRCETNYSLMTLSYFGKSMGEGNNNVMVLTINSDTLGGMVMGVEVVFSLGDGKVMQWAWIHGVPHLHDCTTVWNCPNLQKGQNNHSNVKVKKLRFYSASVAGRLWEMNSSLGLKIFVMSLQHALWPNSDKKLS